MLFICIAVALATSDNKPKLVNIFPKKNRIISYYLALIVLQLNFQCGDLIQYTQHIVQLIDSIELMLALLGHTVYCHEKTL